MNAVGRVGAAVFFGMLLAPLMLSAQSATPPKPKLPPSLKIPTTFDSLFAERDVRAEGALGYLGCMQRTISALRGGALGAVPKEWSIACMQQGAEWRGVFGELTDGAPGFTVRLQYALRGTGVVVRDPVDTARAGGIARALFRGLSAPLPGAGKYEFIPLALPQKTYIEVWFVPVPSNPSRVVVGGDSVIQMSLDGTRELGHTRAAPAIRELALPTNGAAYVLESSEERIPLLSELVASRLAFDFVPQVSVRTRQYESLLTRALLSSRHWKHTHR